MLEGLQIIEWIPCNKIQPHFSFNYLFKNFATQIIPIAALYYIGKPQRFRKILFARFITRQNFAWAAISFHHSLYLRVRFFCYYRACHHTKLEEVFGWHGKRWRKFACGYRFIHTIYYVCFSGNKYISAGLKCVCDFLRMNLLPYMQ